MSPIPTWGPAGSTPGVPARVGSAARSRWTLTIVVAVLLAAALAADPVARRALSAGRVVELGPLQLELAYNSGVAFSVGNGLPPWVLIAVTATITAAIAVYAWRTVPTGSLTGTVGLSAVVAGAAANVIDRAADGRVTDYFHTGWWPTFNLADTYLTCGVVLVVLASLREGRTSVDPTGTEQRSG
ncbi:MULTISPECIES: signal peptidase II [Nocardiaceae]|uniref:signal peptidase II n=1 Tax=Nocardiaceae TaxID=85025 RepID=UPI00050CE287|nr:MULTISPECIES: signal peptidase II [Rhodococcus]AMY56428.1 Lipoprotein signal peptidase [Rhodococcus fascians D188]OZF03997.1 signal peptidase II [Rhodococcus sp. 15-1189-1-1a]OZF18673.1 signal peptidase II [Rhodococcus sp. 14-2686-1-2]OZF36569.1 signal peptidase II [Rhodococcus sp. 14-2496-1d]OZF42135.1 signal peptidase II [Rhodococcus sp. 14-2470-1b]